MINDGAGRRLYVNYFIGNKSNLSPQYLVEHPALSNSPLADTNANLIMVAGPLFDKLLLKTHQLHFQWSYACPIYFGRLLALQMMDCASNLIPNLKLRMVGIDYVHRSIWRWQQLYEGVSFVLGGKSGWPVLEYAFHIEVDSNLTSPYTSSSQRRRKILLRSWKRIIPQN